MSDPVPISTTPPPEEDDDELRRRLALTSGRGIPTGANNPLETPAITTDPAKPVVRSTPNAIPVGDPSGASDLDTYQHKGIDTGQAASVSPQSTTIPHRGAIASLWSKADNIQNPFLRILGKVSAGAARAIDVGASTLAPAIASRIPGTSANAEAEDRQDARRQDQQADLEKEQASTEETKARTDEIKNPPGKNPEIRETDQGDFVIKPDGSAVPIQYEGKTLQPKPAAGKGPILHETEDGVFMVDPETGKATQATLNGVPLKGKQPATKSTKEQIQAQIADAENKGDTATVGKLQKQLKDIDPEGQQRIVIQQGNAERQADNASRKDIATHDKAYVQPAEATEKSYQMMDHAYQEYKQAAAQGKELPTGAQSMLALSTHLATTFGNVKGARVTKDMIAEHLGARSVSDDAEAAIQKLTNGDRLSPAQWDAFHDLVKQSRKLSWDTAVKEANRKKIPVDFLPPDLKATGDQTDEGAGHPFFSQFNGKAR